MINYITYQYPVSVESTSKPTIDLPSTYRVVRIEREPLTNDSHLNTAEIFHEHASLTVSWQTNDSDAIISTGMLVSVTWENQQRSVNGSVQVKMVNPIAFPSKDINLFETIPHEWMKDRRPIKQAIAIINRLPAHFAFLFAAIFWNYKRFNRFILGPSSLNGHHNWKHGNFIHTIEVVNNVIKLAEDRPSVCLEVLMITALLHDAAKADEYKYNYQRSCFEISTRGALIGHKMTLIEWIAAAIAQYQIGIPHQQYLGLIHVLTAVKNCPEWIGLREPISPECLLLSIADRLSGQDDLLEQTMPTNRSFGRYHKHLKGRPFLIKTNPNSLN